MEHEGKNHLSSIQRNAKAESDLAVEKSPGFPGDTFEHNHRNGLFLMRNWNRRYDLFGKSSIIRRPNRITVKELMMRVGNIRCEVEEME